jgi:hypothetical protein
LEEVEAELTSTATTLLQSVVPVVAEVCTKASEQPVQLDKVMPVVTLTPIVITHPVVAVVPAAQEEMQAYVMVVTAVLD